MSANYSTPKYVTAYAIASLATDVTLRNGVIALRCTVGGVVKVDILNGDTGVVIPITTANDIVNLPMTKVYSAGNGTTATGLVAYI